MVDGDQKPIRLSYSRPKAFNTRNRLIALAPLVLALVVVMVLLWRLVWPFI